MQSCCAFGDQGNWWHLLIGAPFFLAFPVIWLRLRSFTGKRLTRGWSCALWAASVLCMLATGSVEMPFVLQLAGTSARQRIAVIVLGFGVIALGAALVSMRRRALSSVERCLVGLETAYLANAAVCIIVYSAATGSLASRPGWSITSVLVWPMALEIGWIAIQSYIRPKVGTVLRAS